MCQEVASEFFCIERTRSTPFVPKLTYWCISYHLGAFGTVCLIYETRWITGRTSAKVRARSRVGIFPNERTRSTPFNPKLMFLCILYHLGVFGTVWLPYKALWKTGRTSAKVRATKSPWNFSQRTHPIHSIGPQTDVLVRFSYNLGAFGTVWLPYETRCKTGRTSAKSSCHEVASEFFATNALDPPHWTLN